MSTTKKPFNRRDFLKVSGGAAAAATAGIALYTPSASAAKARVVIVGGGMGGATAARYIKKADPSIDVTLIEANATYHTCFMSNFVLAGERKLDYLAHGYQGLAAEGINVVHDMVTNIGNNSVSTASGKNHSFDRCIVAPGVDYKYVEGHSDEVADTKITHAWKAGKQTQLLRDQLSSMKDGGTVIIGAPRNPFRCPPGPYERTSLIAGYLKHNKPKSKIIVLDPKDKFSKFGLFMEGWKNHYGYGTDDSLITWVKAAEGGSIEAVDADSMTVSAEIEEFKGDVINIIPDQKAGKIAFTAGLVDKSGWCPVDLHTFESTIRKNIHVIGDASQAKGMPKSGYAASSEAKVCAAGIVALLKGHTPGTPAYVNTCYSVISFQPKDGISVAAIYKLREDGSKIQKVSGGLTPSGKDRNPANRAREVDYALSWYENITSNTFAD
ncbi:MAG: FAD-dependent oxidoreductase [Gammaproteobacteria bacterium]|jgi:sulfide dehydrogenase [flavocytochrome c] flavoprotein subunit|nr:FAD-dependent oxidoreductase [Gammaproteobacteria bacterium]MBT4607941.1 FAD-dependent oxidoreductase [Thiotrichales bacterium]MBT3472275.1 FAD-dependent oxidoreductase [Gammaproteobacteria bacterium]MBT3966936.1 FAD-dependent oxidoreductase [Gammaproteobacteria bacterium]MBT4329064.1 FAD-dependent oxidoreductase [Gammaproteobacteria bacterium]